MYVFGILISFCFFVILPCLTIKACVADAQRRGKSPLIVTVAVFFFFPLGLILWLLFRPEPKDGSGHGCQFLLDDYRVQ